MYILLLRNQPLQTAAAGLFYGSCFVAWDVSVFPRSMDLVTNSRAQCVPSSCKEDLLRAAFCAASHQEPSGHTAVLPHRGHWSCLLWSGRPWLTGWSISYWGWSDLQQSTEVSRREHRPTVLPCFFSRVKSHFHAQSQLVMLLTAGSTAPANDS